MVFRFQWKAVRLPLLLSCLWCLFMVALYQRGNAERDAHTTELALTQARTLYSQVLDARSWNAAHGGVYVPESEYGEPNPWIPEAQRTLALADGQRLVLMNPAYMSRQIGELSSVKGTSFRITSHAPLRPENASDIWETQALLRCVEGASEMFALARDGEKPRYRYLGALYAKKDCLSCHMGSVVGEVRGGISVSLDARPFLQAGEEQERNLRWAFGLMGLTGVVGIGGTSLLAWRRRMLAEERERMKSNFLANMSHDMRTPLTGILGMSDLLEHSQNEEQRREALRYLHLAGATLLEMVSDITDYAALDTGNVRLNACSFDVRQVLQRCLDLFEPQCRVKALYLRLHVEDEVPAFVTGDEFRLRQALGNLISNAVKFTAQGGICIRVSRGLCPLQIYKTSEGKATQGTAIEPVRALAAEPCVLRFAVEDTGVGIAVQDQRRVFERFERGSAPSEGYGGTGLGLSIALDIAVLMGGCLEVESQVGQGSCFTLSLNFTVSPGEAQGSERHAACSAVLEDGGGLSVLVGEDNAITAHYLEEVLTRGGYITRRVGDGLSVLRELEQQRPDMLILDVRMPELDGLATARAIRQQAGPPLPIVVLSASISDEERAAFAALEVQAHLLKPVGAKALLHVVGMALGAQREEVLFDRPAALADMEGDAALLSKLGELWLAEVAERRVELLRACETEDAATVCRVAHGWKNSSAVLHLRRLHAFCARLEKAAPEEARLLVPQVLMVVEETIRMMKKS